MITYKCNNKKVSMQMLYYAKVTLRKNSRREKLSTRAEVTPFPFNSLNT